ncbi:MAG: RNA methyltransferase [Flavobacteriales bacterium]|nr:RNA methyltransferase [Flavobacteriales bacterium]
MTKQEQLLDHLLPFVTENKRGLFERIIAERTRHVTVVLEDIFQPHNASAVLRSCDVFGIQDVHIIENNYAYNVNPKVVMGASKWIDLHKYNKLENNTVDCINTLKNQGFKVYATTPHTDDCLVSSLPLNDKVALMFGTEQYGLSEVAMEHADGFVKIPMYGFTESLNISVSAAISLYEISKRLKESDINWQLSPQERTEILLKWCRKVVKSADLIEKEFMAS